MDDELQHIGIKDMHWYVRRFQYEDGSLTPEGRKRYGVGPPREKTAAEQRRDDKKDSKWARKNYNKIYNSTYKDSRKEFNDFVKNELNKRLSPILKSGRISYEYVNAYNQKLAEIMNKNVKDISAPSGKVVKWVAKRGDVGVHLALADPGYDLGKVKRGVYSTGRIAYKRDSVNTA